MPRSALVRQRLLALFLAAALLLFSPIILQFEAFGRWLGIPVLLIYIFVLWAAIIGTAAWIVTRTKD